MNQLSLVPEPPQPTNQREAVLFYIQRHGEIDFLTAANELGVSQLTARINELRKRGWEFSKKDKSGTNRFGNRYTKTIYYNARKKAEAE